MGKFDGYLICTDWDGTLYFDGEINPKNIEAIKYFCDNGGKFTVCTGRFINFIKGFSDQIKPNTYAITLNGAVITDEAGDILHEGYVDTEQITQSIIDILQSSNNLIKEVLIYPKELGSALRLGNDASNIKSAISSHKNIYKSVLIADDPVELENFINSYTPKFKDTYNYVRSWPTGLEIIKKSNSKSVATLRLKEKLNSKTLICVGDYENDIDMIESADIGYAVDNALPKVKSIADRITVHAKDGAIAQIIYDLEK